MRAAGEKLVLLFVAGVLLLNFPLLAIFNRPERVAGIPVFYLYLFGVWVLILGAVVILARAPWDEGPEE